MLHLNILSVDARMHVELGLGLGDILELGELRIWVVGCSRGIGHNGDVGVRGGAHGGGHNAAGQD